MIVSTSKTTTITLKELIIIIFLLFVFTSCEKDSACSNHSEEFSITIGFDTFGKSKSGYIPDNIADINLFVFDQNQQLIKQLYLSNQSSTTLQTSSGIKTIAVIANVGNLDFSSCSTLTVLRRLTNNQMIGTGGNVIYSGQLTLAISPSIKNIVIPLTRMLSRITYVFDKTNLDPQVNINITKIQLMNIPTECSYFSANTPHSSQIAQIGDALEGHNLEPLNHESATPLYMFENRQGTIGSSSNPVGKHPGPKENVCTYVEITADYSSLQKTGTIKYRNFLGSNTTNDYDIIRENHYQETIIFNGTSINEVSWRVDVSNLQDVSLNIPVTGISLDNSYMQLISGKNYQLNATVYPLNATNRDCTWHSSNPAVVSVNSVTGELTTYSYGSSTITAKSMDGSFEDHCIVDVYDPIMLYTDTYAIPVYNPDNGELIRVDVLLFLRANIAYPSDMNIIRSIEPFINVVASYTFTVRGIQYSGSCNLTLDTNKNNDYPYQGVGGAHEIIPLFHPLTEEELLSAINSISVTRSPGSIYAHNWYVTW